jgi:hypothetical protein
MIKDSIATSVFLFTLWSLASLAVINLASLETKCGFFLRQEKEMGKLTFVPVYSITGFLLAKSIYNLWSGDTGIKVLLFGICFFVVELMITAAAFRSLDASLAIGLAEKLLFGAIIMLFGSMRRPEKRVVMRNIQIADDKIKKCQQPDRFN